MKLFLIIINQQINAYNLTQKNNLRISKALKAAPVPMCLLKEKADSTKASP
jgi:hypothetical protein